MSLVYNGYLLIFRVFYSTNQTRSFDIFYNKPRQGDFLGITLKVAIVTHKMKFFSEGLEESVSFIVVSFLCLSNFDFLGNKRVYTMLCVVATWWKVLDEVWPVSNFIQQVATSRNNTQQRTTWCANARNMLGPTMLRLVGQQCCERLHGPLIHQNVQIGESLVTNLFISITKIF